jgi:sterol desaturase/sphingolipid hydroxylase (fatty acid hydroxylase superfamily)
MWIFSLLKGFLLGFTAHSIGVIMDLRLSLDRFNEIMKEIPKLYLEAAVKIQRNLLIISPVAYAITDQYFLDHSNYKINYGKALIILLFHNSLYYYIHKAMHQINCLKEIHNFHHKFDKYMIPSIGNAVSTQEFLLAYIFPFIFASAIVRPNEITLALPIGFISVFNNIIHCKELEKVKWSIYFVSPKQHIKHHEVRNKHYSAPIFNLDYFLEK